MTLVEVSTKHGVSVWEQFLWVTTDVREIRVDWNPWVTKTKGHGCTLRLDKGRLVVVGDLTPLYTEFKMVRT